MKMDLNQALEQLASAFNTTVENLYPLLIKQAYVTGIASSIGILISWLLLAVVLLIFKKHGIRKDEQLGGASFGTIILTVFSIAMTLVIAIITTTVGYEVITALVNPEYWALKEVLSYLK